VGEPGHGLHLQRGHEIRANIPHHFNCSKE